MHKYDANIPNRITTFTKPNACDDKYKKMCHPNHMHIFIWKMPIKQNMIPISRA